MIQVFGKAEKHKRFCLTARKPKTVFLSHCSLPPPLLGADFTQPYALLLTHFPSVGNESSKICQPEARMQPGLSSGRTSYSPDTVRRLMVLRHSICWVVQAPVSKASWRGFPYKGPVLNVSMKEPLPLKASQVQFSGKRMLKIISDLNFYALKISWA